MNWFAPAVAVLVLAALAADSLFFQRDWEKTEFGPDPADCVASYSIEEQMYYLCCRWVEPTAAELGAL